MGFSTKVCLPASRHAWASAWCVDTGVAIATMSIPSSSVIRRTSAAFSTSG